MVTKIFLINNDIISKDCSILNYLSFDDFKEKSYY